jgi:hypothetical protein
MPIHDWTRVTAGTFHDFHLAWIAALQRSLNNDVLPRSHYAQAAYSTEPLDDGPDAVVGTEPGTLCTATAPPRPRLAGEAEMDDYVLKRRTLVIRHASGDRIVALVEIVSPGNKSSRHGLRSFVEKAVEALYRGYHLLVIDLFPPGPRDPHGLHAAIWGEISDDPYELPAAAPLTLAAYSAGPVKRAYVEPTAVGRELIEMPLFLEPEVYVNVPLEATYRAAYRGVPQRWRQVLEG